MIWSWVLTAVGVFGLFLAGRKVWWAWFVGLGAQALWLAYAIVTDQWGFIVSAFAYGFIYLKNGLAWTRLRERPAMLLSGTSYNGVHSASNTDCRPLAAKSGRAWAREHRTRCTHQRIALVTASMVCQECGVVVSS